MNNTDLVAHYKTLTNEEVLSRASCGRLTEAAQAVAEAELRSRHIPVPVQAVNIELADGQYLGDMVILERGLDPTDAHILCSLLATAGIVADAGDANLVQTHNLLAIAVGGAKIRVPISQLQEARELLAAYKRGDFALDDDFDSEHTES